MNHDEARRLLAMRRDLTRETFNDSTVDAWQRVFVAFDYATAERAMINAASAGLGHVAVADLFAYLPKRPMATTSERTSVHPLNCVCGGEGLLSEMVPDRLRPGQLYKVWRPCPGNERRVVDNPGPEMGLDEYLQRVQRRADAGDLEARRELRVWKRHPANPAQQHPNDVA